MTEREAAASEARELAEESFRVARTSAIDLRDFGPDENDVLNIVSRRIRDEIWRDAEPIDASPKDERALRILMASAWEAWITLCGIEHDAFTVVEDSIETIPAA